MKKIIIVLFFIVFITFINQDKEEYIIPDSAIRLRVIANSNTFEDQATKMEIKNNIESILQKELVVAPNKETASLAIKDKIPEIQNMINHYDIKYNLNYGKNYFPEKSYKGVKYEAGDYESLVITLGSGKGENWWCVLFPPLCLMDAEEKNTTDVEYRLFVKDLFTKYMEFY